MMTVSTVIPVRNRPEFIVRAIASVSAQSHPSSEIIVVDDSSTDETPHIVENLTKTLSNLVLIRLPERVGAAKARNVGAEIAKGDLLAFLDSDDRWYPEKLEKQVNEFGLNDNVVAAFCGILSITDDYSERYVPPAHISLKALYRSDMLGTCSTVMVSKTAFARIGGFDANLPSCQDWDLYIRLAEIGTLSVVQEVLVEYSRHSGERISNNLVTVVTGHNIVFNKIYKKLSGVSDPFFLRIIRGGHECLLAELYCHDEPRLALGHALKGLALAPSPNKLRVFGEVIKHAARQELRRVRPPFVS